jgi:transcriptional regulator with XRE-family HTH domain
LAPRAQGPVVAGSERAIPLGKALVWFFTQCARKLGVSKSHLCDVEKGRKTVSPERAAKWARTLGYPESIFVRLAIQGDLDAAGLKYKVEIEAA